MFDAVELRKVSVLYMKLRKVSICTAPKLTMACAREEVRSEARVLAQS